MILPTPHRDIELDYLKHMRSILSYGSPKCAARTQYDSISLHGATLRCNLQHGFPLLTTKKMGIKTIMRELAFFLEGDCNNLKNLDSRAHNIWEPWATDGKLGPIYGTQWRGWRREGANRTTAQVFDQVESILEGLCKDNPTSRRLIVSAWNVADLAAMALVPCHVLWQVLARRPSLQEVRRVLLRDSHLHPFEEGVREKLGPLLNKLKEFGDAPSYRVDVPAWERFCQEGMRQSLELESEDLAKLFAWRLDMRVDQRSADWFIGVPFNIASYSILTHIIANTVNARRAELHVIPGELVHQFGDTHAYVNQFDQCNQQMQRHPRPLPQLSLTSSYTDVTQYSENDIHLSNYNPHPAIKAPALAI